MIVGLTGGIATGKSTVSNMLRRKGAAIVDADQVAREVVEPGTEGSEGIRRRFGSGVFHSDGSLNRQALRSIVFRDEEARRDLNRILHPLIIRRMKELARHYEETVPSGVVVMDVPLLIEENLTHLVERVILVYIPESMQIKRLMLREGIDEAEARRLIQAQMPIAEKKRFADVIIDNSGTLANTESQVDQLWETLACKNGSDRL